MKQNIRTGCLAFLCTASLTLNFEKMQVLPNSNVLTSLIDNLNKGWDGTPTIYLCIFICMVFLFHKESQILSSKIIGDKILSFFFALATLFGKSYSVSNSWDYFLGNTNQFLFALPLLLGYIVFYLAVIRILFNYLESGFKENSSKEHGFFLKSKSFWKIFLCILICWIPYLIVFFPGSIPHDGYYQLNMAYGFNEITNHHPWLSTIVIRLITSIGRLINDNVGIFLYILVQTLFCCFVFSLICYKIRKYNIPKWAKTTSIIFFAVVPIWGAYTQTLMKDTLYYGLFALFYILYLEIIENQSFQGKRKAVLFIILSCILVQYRNEGIYIITLSLLALFIVIKRQKRLIFSSTVIVIACHMFFSSIILPAMNVQSGSIREMLSVPFQQTARYVTLYEDEVTEEEKRIIDQVLNYGAMKERYNPINSDPIKDSFKNATKEELLDYAKVWFYQFIKHPTCYIQATLNNCFGYWYPEYVQDSLSNLQFYIKGEPIATGDLDIYYISDEKARNLLSNYSLLWFKIPVLSWFMYPGTYTWILILCLFALCRKKLYKFCVAGVPLLLTIAICLISPVNGYVRYVLPIMAVMPLIIAFTLNQYKSNV